LNKILITAVFTLTTPGLVGQSLYNKSVKELDKGDTIQSLKLLNELLQDDPKNIKGYFLRAQIFINTNQIDKAISEGDFMGAIEDIDERIKLEPANAKVYFERGYCDLMRYEWENAIRDYSKAIHFDSVYKDAYAARGFAKLKALTEKDKFDPDGIEKASACSDLRKAKQLGFDSGEMLRVHCEE